MPVSLSAPVYSQVTEPVATTVDEAPRLPAANPDASAGPAFNQHNHPADIKSRSGYAANPALRKIVDAKGDVENDVELRVVSLTRQRMNKVLDLKALPRAQGGDLVVTQALNDLCYKVALDTKGFFENVVRYYADSGVSEIDPLMDQNLRRYVQKPGNLYDDMRCFPKGKSERTALCLLTMLVQLETFNAADDKILNSERARQAKFDVNEAIESVEEMRAYFHSMKAKASDFAVPDTRYFSSLVGPGMRLLTSKKINVSKMETAMHLSIHAASAMRMDAIKMICFPEAYERTVRIFNRQKLVDRVAFWYEPEKLEVNGTLPKRYPRVDELAFSDIASLRPDWHASLLNARAALIKIRLPDEQTQLEIPAQVAVHKSTGNCLIKFLDHTAQPERYRYAVSSERPPMGENDILDHDVRSKMPDSVREQLEVTVFEEAGSALEAWHKGTNIPEKFSIKSLFSAAQYTRESFNNIFARMFNNEGAA